MTTMMANVARCTAFVTRVLSLSGSDRSTVVAAGIAADACPLDPLYNWPSVGHCTAAGNINSAWEQAYRTVPVQQMQELGDQRDQLNVFRGTFGANPDDRETFFFRLAAGAAYATLVYDADPPTYTTLYGPFESVIPFASL